MLQAIKWQNCKLQILDQLFVPNETRYIPIPDVSTAWDAIRSMKVRGAPAIAIVAILGLATEIKEKKFNSKADVLQYVLKQLAFLLTSRPTAVNLKNAADDFETLARALHADEIVSVQDMKDRIVSQAGKMLEDDIITNKAIGKHGSSHILDLCSKHPVSILTHCNTGSLATAGYGTALGVIRSLHNAGKLHRAYCTETRPYNQGARLTAFELVHDKIPSTLICDDMVAALMQSGAVSAVVVGADRVVANGDTANKIGTYQIAICAKYHGVPFYVASPTTTVDATKKTGKEIPIEERPHREVTHLQGLRLAPDGMNCWNPAFDVTPAELITGGIITEKGVFKPSAILDALKS
ncbi:methylthioribose-1-phosphate isomerase-like [Ornithodoros turicata]|uniref:methylthioribose-1-phosphate isomerase-like n=1 Tax=Ornithodoros turicata TaxID=34597 RepID=UPI0031398350